MTEQVTQLAIDDIADLADGIAGLRFEDALEISLMDVVIAIIDYP